MNPPIIVEGKSDKEFLLAYTAHIKKQYSLNDIIVNGGNNLKGRVAQAKTLLDVNENIFVIFDADDNYSKSKLTIECHFKDLGPDANRVKVFLFPNNMDSGNLETLLENIVPEDYKFVVNCFNKYIKCISSNPKALDSNIDKKSIMYAYREAVGLEKKIKQLDKKIKQPNSSLRAQENYLDIFADCFVLDSEYLKPLCDFLHSP